VCAALGVGSVAKGGAAKVASTAVATTADLAEAAAVLVVGGAVNSTGTSIITKVRRCRFTPG